MAFEKPNPQHDMHVNDWALAVASRNRSYFSSSLDEPSAYADGGRYNRDDLHQRANWDLP